MHEISMSNVNYKNVYKVAQHIQKHTLNTYKETKQPKKKTNFANNLNDIYYRFSMREQFLPRRNFLTFDVVVFFFCKLCSMEMTHY